MSDKDERNEAVEQFAIEEWKGRDVPRYRTSSSSPREQNGYPIRPSFRERIDLEIATYIEWQDEIDTLLANNESEHIIDLIQWATQEGIDVSKLVAPIHNAMRTCPINPLRQGVIDSMVNQPYTLMLTIASPLVLSDQDNIDNLWHLYKRMNRDLFGRSWSKHRKQGMTGIVVGEPHTFSTYLRGSLHFHSLLTQPPEMADIEWVRAVALKHAPLVKDMSGNPAFDVSMVDIRPICDLPSYNLHGLAQYLTKSMEHPVFANGDYMMPLHPSGIHGIAMRSWKEITNY